MNPAPSPLDPSASRTVQGLPTAAQRAATEQAGLARVLRCILMCVVLANPLNAMASRDWGQLSPKQQELLSPLQREWSTLTPTQRDKWLRLGQRYETQPPERQALMRERVGNWNELSPQDRARARENFKALQNTQKGERNSQWNRYQSLESIQRERFRERMDTRPQESRPLAPEREGRRGDRN